MPLVQTYIGGNHKLRIALLCDYEIITKELQIAIEADDNRMICELDRKISSIFDQVIETTPSCMDEALQLIDFLLEHLLDFDKGSSSSERIKTRILFLAKMTF